MGESVVERARKALLSEPRVQSQAGRIELGVEGDALVAEGEVSDVAVKKLALRRLATVPGVSGIVDRLRVEPAQRMGDGEIRDLVRDALLQDAALADLAILVLDKGSPKIEREPPGEVRGRVVIGVEDGVVTLDGDVHSLAQKRLAGVLAWWVPGSRDVVNGLGVEPPEDDSDEEITEAVRIALEKDPFVNATQIRVQTREAVVELQGLVPKRGEREAAEYDAWYVFGVEGVVNRVEYRPESPPREAR